MNQKEVSLQEVGDLADIYRDALARADVLREAWIDRMVEAREAGATQQEIAEMCPNPEGTGMLSRQRIAQFLKERA